MSQRDRWEPGTQAVFTYSLAPDPTSEVSARLAHRSGTPVTVLAEQDPDGVRAELPTLRERADAAALLTYRVRFADGHEDDAFEDELAEELQP